MFFEKAAHYFLMGVVRSPTEEIKTVWKLPPMVEQLFGSILDLWYFLKNEMLKNIRKESF